MPLPKGALSAHASHVHKDLYAVKVDRVWTSPRQTSLETADCTCMYLAGTLILPSNV